MSPSPIVHNPGSFSSVFNRFFKELNDREGGDTSGRKFTAWVRLRNKNYWGQVFDDARVINTDDIAAVADAFHKDPFEFVRLVNAGDLYKVPKLDGTYVVPPREYEEVRDIPTIGIAPPLKRAAKTKKGPREDQGTSS